MTGSTYSPQTWNDVEVAKVMPNTFGFSGTATASTTTNIDKKIDDDCFFRGLQLILKNPLAGDTVTIQIIDIDGVYFSVNTVVSTPVTNFNIDSVTLISYDSVAPFKILGGLYIRFAYTSTSMSTAVTVSPNLLLLNALL